MTVTGVYISMFVKYACTHISFNVGVRAYYFLADSSTIVRYIIFLSSSKSV